MAKVKAPRQVVAEIKEIKHQQEELKFNPAEQVAHYWDKNSKKILTVLGGLLAVALLAGLYFWYQGTQNAEANQKLAAAVKLLESGQPQQALDGVGKTTGLRKISENYSGTDAGNIAKLHTASALLALNKAAEAYKTLENFDKGDNALSANAYASMAAIKEDEKNYKAAAELYNKAAETFKNEQSTPQFLLNAARVNALSGDKKTAGELISQIKSQYATSATAQNLDFEIAQFGL